MKEKAKYNMFKCLGYMFHTAWDTRKRVPLMCLLLAVLNTIQSLLQLFLAPEILKRVEETAPLGELLTTIGLFTLALVLFTGITKYVDINTHCSRIDVRIRVVNDINGKAATTSYPNTLDPEMMKLLEKAQRVINNNNQAAQHIWTTLTELLTNLFGFVIYLLLLRNLDRRLLGVVLATSVISFFVTLHIQRRDHNYEKETAKHFKKLRYIENKAQSTTLAKDIRIFGLREWLDDVYHSIWRLCEVVLKRRERLYLIVGGTDAALLLARNGIAYLFLIRMMLTGGLPVSRFLLYFTAVTGFTTWITGILNRCATLHKECLDLSYVLEYLDLPEPFRFEGGRPLPDGKSGFKLQLKNVSYRYPGAEQDTIHDLNLTIRAGEKLAVVGLNGAGKTTLVKLLCGFFDPTAGEILLNGTDIREFNRRDYYTLFSAVFQEYSDLNVTLAENVAQAVEGIDRTRVEDCLEKAGLTGMAADLPRGIDTHVGRKVYLDGVLFSGGQTQRLMLARALYKDGPFLILDEPTAALDPIAENDMYLKYNEMTAGKISVFISHRLASTRFCDRIIFLKEGVITEEGTHEELLTLSGGYAELFEVQSRYYREGRDF